MGKNTENRDLPLVLVVDDDPMLRLLMRNALEQADFSVEETDDGLAAIDMALQKRPDIMLLDVMMPRMDGFSVCTELRGHTELEHLPVVMVTALDDSGSITRAYGAGATNFITKPINWPNLAHHVRYILRSSQAFEALHKSQEKLLLAREVFDNSDELIAITDANANIIDANPAFTRLTGFSREEIIGKNMQFFRPDAENPRFYEDHRKALRETGRWQGEMLGRRKNGEVFSSIMTINAVRNSQGETTHYVNISMDITRLKEAEARLSYLASFDPLTDLPNRGLLRDRLQQAAAEAARSKTLVAVLLLDLDNMKDINDTFGHPAGDRVLVLVAQRLKAGLRESDTVARMSGDEFVLVIKGFQDPASVAPVAQKVLENVASPLLLDGREIFVTASMGIALTPLDGRDADELIKKADTAMNHAKQNGKNRCRFFSEEMNTRTRQRMEMLTSLRKALDRDELVAYFQPKIDLKSGRICGSEALIRWQHPQRGLVLPGEFIGLAEESGLIVPLGEKILHMACSHVRLWQEKLPPMPVAVNLSTVQFTKDDLLNTVRRVLDRTRLDPRWLELEITESVIMQDTAQGIGILKELQAMGIRVMMDDFGTGYSSLSYLKRLPVSSLKIDYSFVKEVTTDPDDAAIVRAIIAIAHNLGLTVVAEGVETREQWQFLHREGCDEVQGFYFARPMPAEEFFRLIAKNPRFSLAPEVDRQAGVFSGLPSPPPFGS